MTRLLVVQHVAHERLGTLEPAFKAAGCALQALDASSPKTVWPSPGEFDGVVVMGGPQSVYATAKYPWIRQELAFLRGVIKTERPVLGVCLGAQLLAAALGAAVTPAPQKEIGWYPLMREPGADGDPLFGRFGQTETVFQWHGDTFALPKGAVRLASSPLCPEQGFRYRDHVYALQFHVEVTEAMIRAWMQTPVNKAELAGLRGIIDPMAIRRQAREHVSRLGELSRHIASAFAALLAPASATQGARHARKA
jgi:GMP synthase (glutamine-hydrolysing)